MPTVRFGKRAFALRDAPPRAPPAARVAAATAKQVVIQKIKEAEKEVVIEEFSDKEGEMVIGTVTMEDARNYYIDFGNVRKQVDMGQLLAALIGYFSTFQTK